MVSSFSCDYVYHTLAFIDNQGRFFKKKYLQNVIYMVYCIEMFE